MCDLGWHGLSGYAPGSDEIYYEGAKQSKRFKEVGFTNILPWDGFEKGHHDPANNFWDLKRTGYMRRAYWLGIGARGTDAGLGKGGIAMHSRNAMQVLEIDLTCPVRLVSCYAKPRGKEGRVQGGTDTAVGLALHFGIDVCNLATDEGLERALNFLERYEIKDERTIDVETNVAGAVYATAQTARARTGTPRTKTNSKGVSVHGS